MIHNARFGDMRRAVRSIERLPAVRAKATLIRVESFD
jgi:hypothetical protein